MSSASSPDRESSEHLPEADSASPVEAGAHPGNAETGAGTHAFQPDPAEPKIFLTAEWRHLLMLNYIVEPDLLAPLVPAGTELDEWGGNTYVSIVGFLFLKTRVIGIPVPFHRDFEEVNLRFYVRRRGPEGWRRGVVFVKEIVPKRAIAFAARTIYGEPYVAMPMRHRVDGDDAAEESGSVEYAWRFNGRWNSMRARKSRSARPLAPGSEAEFITEHYWGYTATTDGGCREYRVAHEPWLVAVADEAVLDCDVAALYGPHFEGALRGAPHSAFIAEGSPITVYEGRKIR